MGDHCNTSACSNLSDHSENSSDGLPSHSHGLFSIEKVCRDFMRNACNRGSHCRFRHPAEEEAKRFSEDFSPREMTFCHDFQNKGCNRHDCRFIHCTRDEEEVYRSTGTLPKFVQNSTTSRKLPPICIDFNKGACQRGHRCKYRHIFSEEVFHNKEDTDLRKKRKYDAMVSDEVNQFKGNSIDYQLLEEENGLLRRRIEDLERQLSVLVASNELLLEQNARYRSCKLITVPPIVAVSQMLTPTITPAPISVGSRPVTALHHQTPHGITTMATLSIGASQREFVIPSAQPPPQPQQQSLSSQAAGVDQSISMAIAPVTIETVPMTLSNGALSQQQTIAAALSLSMPHPSPASLCSLMGNSNLVSYPLISHARLPTSSLG